MRKTGYVAILVGALSSSSALAQTTAAARAETIVPARLAVLPSCPLAQSSSTPAPEAFLGGVIAPFLGGLAGDFATAGINALAGALEEASKERAIGARGVTTFNFYRHLENEGKYNFRNRLRPEEAYCLVLSVDDDSQADLEQSHLPTSNNFNLPADSIRQLNEGGFYKRPKLYVEAALVSKKDGFVVQPATIWYPVPLKGASRRGPMPTELHVTFATPDSTKLESALGSAFAIARIQLPAIAPGQVFDARHLSNIGSALLPARPENGTASTHKTSLAGHYQATITAQRELDIIRENLANAKALGLTAAEIKAARTQAKRKELELRRLEVAPAAAWSSSTRSEDLGGTSVEARFLLIKNANKFGLAIAAALKTRGTTLGTNLATELTQQLTPDAAWTDAETQYVSAMLTVRQKQVAYDAALTTNDQTKILTAEVELKNAQAQANGKAVAAKKPLPFPNIL